MNINSFVHTHIYICAYIYSKVDIYMYVYVYTSISEFPTALEVQGGEDG